MNSTWNECRRRDPHLRALTIDYLLLESTIRGGFLHGKEERKRRKNTTFFSSEIRPDVAEIRSRVLCLFIEIFNSRCKYIKKRDRRKIQKQDRFLSSAIKIEFSFPVDFEAYKIVSKKYEEKYAIKI